MQAEKPERTKDAPSFPISDRAAKDRDRELYDARIDWLLNRADSELGSKGTLDGTIVVLEHGGQLSGVPNTDRYSDYQMGWCVGDSPADKWRRWAPVWFRLTQDEQATLIAHYLGRNDMPAQRVAVIGELAKMANVALWLRTGERLAKLIESCMNKKLEGRKEVIKAAKKDAEAAIRGAHCAFAAIADTCPEGSPVHGRDLQTAPDRSGVWEKGYAKRQELKRRVNIRQAEWKAIGDSLLAPLFKYLRALHRKPRAKGNPLQAGRQPA